MRCEHRGFLKKPFTAEQLLAAVGQALRGAEGGPGDPQVESFSDTGYSEKRGGLRMTAFGGSPRANLAARMLAPLKFKGALKL